MAILKIPNVGSATFWKQYQKFQNIADTFQEFSYNPKLEKYEHSMEKLQGYHQKNIFCIGFWEKVYPKALKNLHNPPPLIWYKGKINLLAQPCIAIVGGRNASYHVTRFAKNLSEELASKKLCIVSGLARGIDTAAHHGAIAVKGSTITILAGGIEHIYPKENKPLYERIIKDHLAISEMPPDTTPVAELFPRRNRLIAALSNLGLCIIEAAEKSGSLITAKHALDLGIPIFACPGHPYDPRSKGCNKLIKQGAYVLENAEDIFEHINFFAQPSTTESIKYNVTLKANDQLNQKILNMLSHTPITLDTLMQEFIDYSTTDILKTLAELELKNYIQRPSPNLIMLGSQ